MFNKLKQFVLKKKAQKLAEEEKKANIERLRQLIKVQFYPFLKTKFDSIYDVSTFCQQLSGYIHSGFNSLVNNITIEDLDLAKDLKGEDTEEIKQVIEMVKDETVYDALMIFDGMSKAINTCFDKEAKKRKIEELEDLEKDFA